MALNEINSFNSLVWCLNLARLGKHSYNFERENIMDYIRDRGERIEQKPAKRFPLHRIKPKLIYNGNGYRMFKTQQRLGKTNDELFFAAEGTSPPSFKNNSGRILIWLEEEAQFD